MLSADCRQDGSVDWLCWTGRRLWCAAGFEGDCGGSILSNICHPLISRAHVMWYLAVGVCDLDSFGRARRKNTYSQFHILECQWTEKLKRVRAAYWCHFWTHFSHGFSHNYTGQKILLSNRKHRCMQESKLCVFIQSNVWIRCWNIIPEEVLSEWHKMGLLKLGWFCSSFVSKARNC